MGDVCDGWGCEGDCEGDGDGDGDATVGILGADTVVVIGVDVCLPPCASRMDCIAAAPITNSDFGS